MNPVAVMQGRLSPRPVHRMQAFPGATWESEFARARECGFDAIEWLFEADNHAANPIWTETGVERIRHAIDATGVRVLSVCADYFMSHPLHRATELDRKGRIAVLERLIGQASRLEVRTILLPVLETSELRTAEERVQLLAALRAPLEAAAEREIRLGLETELPAAEYRALVEEAAHPALRVYYDTGNAGARGYGVETDILQLGDLLCGVHLKDRRPGGPSVPFGEGAVAFPRVFESLRCVRYEGPLVLQYAFGTDFLSDARSHLEFTKRAWHAAERSDDALPAA